MNTILKNVYKIIFYFFNNHPKDIIFLIYKINIKNCIREQV